MSSCDHENREWDWGETRPAAEYCVVPGYCPDCETRFERHYEFTKVTER